MKYIVKKKGMPEQVYSELPKPSYGMGYVQVLLGRGRVMYVERPVSEVDRLKKNAKDSDGCVDVRNGGVVNSKTLYEKRMQHEFENDVIHFAAGGMSRFQKNRKYKIAC